MIHRLTAPVVLPADPACSVIRDGAVDIDETGRITYCGPASEATAAAETTAHKSGILLPGLVNTHAHSPMVLLRGMGGDLPLLRWLREVIWPTEARLRPSDVHAGMVLGSVEMLRRGVTTSAEMYFHAEQMADAVLTTGARGIIGGPIIDLPGLDWRSLLADATKWIDADGLRFGPGDRIELSYAGHSAYMLPAEALGAIADDAATRGALVQIHVAEAAEEDAAQRAEHGSVPKLLDEVGLLRGRLIAAHAVHLSDEDIALLASRGTGVAHCPGSNAKLASGIARLADLRAADIHIGLGTDGPSSNDDLDLWEEVQLSAMLSRLAEGDATALTAPAALLLATRGGADALGRDDIGALEPGRWADVVHVDVDDPAFATGLDVPDDQLLGNLVWAAGSRRVRDVWVAGEQVVTDGESSRVDRGQAQANVAAAARRLRTA
ncbi:MULTISPECIES: amidohydrolase family protein [Prauserella salsuginis group]|uniref:5-methylthioadenosine/S-adenosylhomocysteine deaminase n=2 Tax=Prauserella salsuginis group TaxID=2893672 RepID=A0A839XSG4_9PSEU|nr:MULTISPECIES: amidohydrolase family protein [Prauserella salsuginis group]MBB3662805.1 5-methylthioadenosine/S-adenosylhomocysteine deaminase [Prauserella sediminis]MCR3720501.1 Cytosine/adenosine deaminase [Prauserella flava]MCR3733789.1 Cytosine/adenosine deaminase [Prauserella salsuginis]